MSVVYSSTLKTNRLQLVADLIAGKTAAASTGTASAGSLVILSATSVVLATIPLGATPGTVSGSVLTISGVPLNATAVATGTAALAQLRNAAGDVICSGLTVGTSGADVIIASTAITVDQTVTLTSGTITHG